MNVLSRSREKRQSLKEFVNALKICIPTAILTVDDLWGGINQEKTDEFVATYNEMLNAYAEDGDASGLLKELEDRNISIRLGEDFFTRPSGKRKYSLVDKLPCKIGDEVWCIRKYKGTESVKKGVVNEMFFRYDMELAIVVHHLVRGIWGETVFGTKEEAEKAIAERGKKNEQV